MAHDANKVYMGTTYGNIKEIGNRKGTVAAGLGCRLKSDGTVTTASADGQLVGISVGKDLSDTNKVAVCYKGVGVPVKLASGATPAVGGIVYINNTTGEIQSANTSATTTAAVFSRLLSDGAVDESTATITAALIDFPGGL